MKRFLLVFALFAALIFVVSCGSGSKNENKGDNADTGETVSDDDAADSDEPAGDTDDGGDTSSDTGDSTDTTPDGGDSASDSGDSQPDDDADTEPKPKEEGIYLGIIGFNKDQAIQDIGILDKDSVDDYTDFISKLNKADYTGLYFADYTALKMMRDYQIPANMNLKNVALVTFTDGLDNISTASGKYDPEDYSKGGDPDVYRDTLHDKIVNVPIHDLPVTAYTIGLKGKDVNDDAEFNTTLEKLASEPKGEYVFYAENMEEVMQSFDIIAKSLYSFSKTVSLKVSIPGGYKDGMKLRLTFDINCDSDSNNCDGEAADSDLYIEATFKKSGSERTLEDIKYHGFAQGLTKISGTLEEVTYRFVFEDIKYSSDNNPLLNRDYQKINLWKQTSNGIWDHETEFKRDNSSKLEEEKSSALIMLVLDCTTSLGNEFGKMKQAGQDFVTTLFKGNNGSNTRVSDCTGRPANAEWNTVEQITQTWNDETGWQPTTAGAYSETSSTSRCYFKCEKDYFWNGSECVNPCDSDPCNHTGSTGVCTATNAATYTCGCEDNYEWNPSSNKCKKNPCLNNPCNIPNSTGCNPVSETQYTCGCKANYFWDSSAKKCTSPCESKCPAHDGFTNTCKASSATQYSCVYKDSSTNYIWSERYDRMEWQAAVDHCTSLNSSNYGGYSSGWHLPTIDELKTLLIADRVTSNCAVSETNGCLSYSCWTCSTCTQTGTQSSSGTFCNSWGTSYVDGRYSKFGETEYFWSSSIRSDSDSSNNAWLVNFTDGFVRSRYHANYSLLGSYYVRCVR